MSLSNRQRRPSILQRPCTTFARRWIELPSGDRELIVLKHLDGWTYDELAERLEIPRGTVMSRLFHARQRLKALMSRPGGGPR